MSVIGLRLGPFEIVREARVPEPGQWYRAIRTGQPKRRGGYVFIRLLEAGASGRAKAALQHEFETLKALADPRAPEPVAFYEGNGALILGAGEGISLDTLVHERDVHSLAMGPATLLDLGLEISETLVRAHNRNVIHGCLTPHQVVLASDGKVWIWGFGTHEEVDIDPRWMPPEIAREGEPGPATDQWCLGAFLSALVTGKPPWRGDDPMVEARRGDPTVAVESVERQWPALGRVLRRLMDPQPEHRFGWIHNARQELLMLARNAPGASDRKDLAAELMRRSTMPAEATAETAIETLPDGTAPEDAPLPSKVKRENLPVEPFPVVRVELEDEVPMARRSETPARSKQKSEPALDVRPEPADADNTELFTEPAPTELVPEGRPTEILSDRAPTELYGQSEPAIPELPSLVRAPEPVVDVDDLMPQRTPEPVFAAVEEEPSLPSPSPVIVEVEEAPSISDPPPPARLAGLPEDLSAPEPIVPAPKEKVDYELEESDIPIEPPRPPLLSAPTPEPARPTVVPVTDPDAHTSVGAVPVLRLAGIDDELPVIDEPSEPLPEPQEAWIKRAAPWFAVAMIAILAAYTIGRYFG